jgi:uncharacterized protein (TIGR00255 family)
MIKSMTGYAATENVAEKFSVRVEIRAVNSRFLDMVLRVPNGFAALEEKIKGSISARLTRGRIEAKVSIQDTCEDAVSFEIDFPRARGYYTALLQLKEALDLRGKITLDMITTLGDTIKMVEQVQDPQTWWPVVEGCILQALDHLESMQITEGRFMAEDLSGRLDAIEHYLDRLAAGSAELLPFYQERLKERIAALTHDLASVDPARIAQEAAFWADRSDISEEITRARSHIQQCRDTILSDEPGGRKLNFLMQELNREFNTMGAKIGNAELAHAIIEVKSELEKMREQIQNIA